MQMMLANIYSNLCSHDSQTWKNCFNLNEHHKVIIKHMITMSEGFYFMIVKLQIQK